MYFLKCTLGETAAGEMRSFESSGTKKCKIIESFLPFFFLPGKGGGGGVLVVIGKYKNVD